jgi:hypothetical protein
VANIVFNISKGKVAELAQRVTNNDPANSILVLEAINAGAATDATLMDLDTFAQIEADANAAEVTNSGYARKTFPDGTVTITIDDTNDRMDVDVADQTWTAVAAGSAWTDLIFGYDSDSTGGTDANVVPLTMHDFTVTPDGSDITATIAVFFRAS